MAYTFPEKTEKKFQWLLTRYPHKDAVLIPILHYVQNELGHLTPESMEYVGTRLDLSPARVKEVASFYTLFRFNDQGRYVLQVCHTMSCFLKGAEDIIEHLKKKLNIEIGEVSSDGLFSIEPVECLASCGTAPVMQVNLWDFHEELTLEKVDQVIDGLRAAKWADESYDKRKSEGAPA